MNPDKTNNGGTSPTMSHNGPKGANKSAAGLSEAEYLAEQATAAKAAISATVDALKAKLGQSVDVRGWTREHPWISLGSALVAGFTTASTLVPSKDQQALNRLAAIEKTLRPNPVEANEPTNGNGKKAASAGGMMQTLMHELLAIVRPAIISLVSSGIAGRQNASSQEPPDSDSAADEAANSRSPKSVNMPE